MTTGGHLSNVLYGDEEIQSSIDVQTKLGSPSRTVYNYINLINVIVN